MPLLSGNPSTPSRTVNNNKKENAPCSVTRKAISKGSQEIVITSNEHTLQSRSVCPMPFLSSHPPPLPTPGGFSTKLCSDMCAPALNPGGERADCHSSVKAAWVGRWQRGRGGREGLCPEIRTPAPTGSGVTALWSWESCLTSLISSAIKENRYRTTQWLSSDHPGWRVMF